MIRVYFLLIRTVRIWIWYFALRFALNFMPSLNGIVLGPSESCSHTSTFTRMSGRITQRARANHCKSFPFTINYLL